ncbi:acyl-CoA thioesterase II [Myxococcota bacterium]|nr:acyl-CoA thioesterase II [Myxococcota bacterium]
MSDVLSELVELLSLEQTEPDSFRGQSQDLGWGRVFGGQLLGQALSAAEQTVEDGRAVHSLHGYFLRPAFADKPLDYAVERMRDGSSFSTRRVVAVQEGRTVFNMAASFQAPEKGLEHQDKMPEAPSPDGLLPESELVKKVAHLLPEPMRARILAPRPIEIRPVEPFDMLQPKKRSSHQLVWYRATGSLPDIPSLHQYLLAYASDFHFLSASLHPHGTSWAMPDMQVASLDHSMYFYRPFRMDEWLLYSIQSPSASGSRGLVKGQFFTQDGELVACTTQEGLIRKRQPSAAVAANGEYDS